MYGYVYKFTLIPTGKIYIGQHKHQTFDENYYGSGVYWSRAISEYDKTDIKREILCWCSSLDEMNKKEIEYIAKYNSTDLSIGYNLSEGGGITSLSGEANPMFGKHHSQDTKKLLSQRAKQGYEEGTRVNPMCFEEHRQSVSLALMGHDVTEESKSKLSSWNKNAVDIYHVKTHKRKRLQPEDAIKLIDSGEYYFKPQYENIKPVWVKNIKTDECRYISWETYLTYTSEWNVIPEHDSNIKLTPQQKAASIVRNFTPDKKHKLYDNSGEHNPMFGVKRAWVTNGIEDHLVRIDELQIYIDQGYSKGRCRK